MDTLRAIARPLRSLAVALALGAGWTMPAHAIPPLGFFFLSQAFDRLASGAFGPAGERLPPSPSWPVTRGAAELINERLPLESADGFVILMARAPAPAALEIQATAPAGAAPPTPAELDEAWGPGLVAMFCGPQPTLWTRWIAIGGTVGLEVRSADGSLVRRYGASRADCNALASSRR